MMPDIFSGSGVNLGLSAGRSASRNAARRLRTLVVRVVIIRSGGDATV